MGGYGSGRWPGRDRRQVVEKCLFVDADDLPFLSFHTQQFSLPVHKHGGETAGMLPCRIVRLNGGKLALRYQIHLGDGTLAQVIRLGTTPARSGGRRTCFLCPTGENPCGPCRKLYAPPGAQLLGCRNCHRLAYASSQRRAERLARADAVADDITDEAGEFLARVERGEKYEVAERLRVMRRLSHAVNDLWESLRQHG